MATYYVPQDFATLAAATAATVDDDTIYVGSTYAGNENVIVTSNSLNIGFDANFFNVSFQFASNVLQLETYGSSVRIIANARNNYITTGDFGDIVDGATGSDDLRAYGGDDTISANIDGNDYIVTGSGNDVVILYGDVGGSGRVDGDRNSRETVKSSNLGGFSFFDVELLDTANVLATVAQLASFEEIGDSTAASSAITFRLQGEGGAFNATAQLRGTDSARFVDAGLTSRVSLTGTAFADLLSGSRFDDTLSGGNGADSYVVNDGGDQVVEAAGQGDDLVQSSISHTLADNVERLTLTGAAAVDATGNGLVNTLVGNAAANVLDGGGNSDRMSGADGDDTYVVDTSGDTVTESPGGGTDLVRSSVTFTLSDEVEDLLLTGAASVNAIGNDGRNTLTGNAAVNALTGKGGDDTYVVQNTDDIVVEAAGEGDDLVRSSADFALGDHVEALILTGAGPTDATGNELANALTGNGGANSLNGRGGADVMSGLAGDDTYFVDARSDKTVELANEGTDAVRSSVTWTLAANVENLTLVGTAANATGNALANTLKGNSARNSLDGGAGKDVLQGFGGADSFLFMKKPAQANVDRVVDFSGADLFKLDNAGFKGLAAGRLTSAQFEAIDALSERVDSSERILYDRDTGALYFDRNGGGRDLRVKFADLDNEAALNHLDFQVI